MNERIALLKGIAARAHGVPALEPKAVTQAKYFHNHDDLEGFQFNFEQEFVFVGNFLPLSVADIEALDGLFQWLVAELINESVNYSNNPIIHVLKVCAALDFGDGQLWKELESVGPLRGERIEQLTQLVISHKTTIKRYHRHFDHVDEQFLLGCAHHNWESIDSVIHHIIDFLYDPRLSCAVRSLSILSPLSLYKILNDLDNVEALISVINILIPIQTKMALKAAIDSKSWPLKFFTLRLSLDQDYDSTSNEFDVLWAQLLLQASEYEEEWVKWIAVFNAYPSRYPKLQRAIGITLCGASEASLIQFFDVMELSSASKRQDLMHAFKEVQGCEDKAQRNLIWTIAHKRWEKWDFGIAAANNDLFSLQSTALDFAVAMYYHDYLSEGEMAETERKLRAEFYDVKNSWYESITEYVSAYNRHLSRFQPLGHAQNDMCEGDSWVEGRHWYNPDWNTKDLYWDIRNRLL